MEIINNSGYLIAAVPLAIILLGGVVLALVRWGQHPVVSLFAVLGLGGLLVLEVLQRVLSLQLLMRLHAQGMAIRAINLLQTGLNITFAVLEALAWVCVLAAIFGWRSARPAATPK